MTQQVPYKELKTLGNVPISMEVLQSLYKDYQSPNMHISMLEKKGLLIRLKRGLYVVSPEISGKELSLGLVANHLYGPSYVSLHWALRWYGLIPERIDTVTSITTRHTRGFENSLGRFTFRGVSQEYFPIGIKSQEDAGLHFLLASPEKALCDMLMQEKHVPDQSISRLEVFFEEDMRIDLEDLRQMDDNVIRQCMEAGNKKQVLTNLLKLIER
ncbi:MAG: hypothetical protein IJ909_12150 [Fibrobacter sp.]|jgi:Predicted transcriptional regulator|nr:hypothetical protein [Fibrobacter sp.]